MPVISEVKEKIDPTVPSFGLPEGVIESAEWVEHVEQVPIAGGLLIDRKKRVPVINGMAIHTDTPETVMRQFINLFPKVAVMLPMPEEEARQMARTGKRPAEVITLNGCRYTVPKGVVVQAPSPIAEIIMNMVNPIRTPMMQGNINREEFNPLGADVPFSL